MTIKRKNQKGFSLIELMIVIAIICILAAIAIPSYLNYTTKAKISEGLALASSAKVTVVEYATSHNGVYPSMTESGLGGISANAVLSVALPADNITTGVITITYALGVGMSAQNVSGILTLTPSAMGTGNDAVTWACVSTNILQKYLPSSCTFSS